MNERGFRVEIQANSIAMHSELRDNQRWIIFMQLFNVTELFKPCCYFALIFSLWIDSSLLGDRSGGSGGLK